MKYNTLGRTKLKVSVAALGCGGSSALGLYTNKSEKHSINIVKKAIDLGINFIDTASSYGTEKIVGKAIKNVTRDKVYISTKHHICLQNRKHSIDDIVFGLENSLRELDTDYVDIFHLHGVTPEYFDYALTLIPKLMREKEKGKFRYLGITESSPLDFEQISISRALDLDIFDVVMFAYSIMNQNAKKNIFSKALSNNVGTMIMFAVRGLFSNPRRLKKEIKKLINIKLLPNYFETSNGPLIKILNGNSRDIIDLCYRYVRYTNGVNTVLFGTGNYKHLIANVNSILSPSIDNEILKEINLYFKHLVGIGLDFPKRSKKSTYIN